ncbi:MAG: DNA-3-methyladenine glycosylase [Vulcanimicrobiaceae bacterium]
MRRAELPADSVDLARFLLGTILVCDSAAGRCAIRIVETEAYTPGDPAAHAYRRETARNRSLFLRRGHAYVYFIYGMYYCINVSSEVAGVGAGVLVRAGEAVAGRELMHVRRPHASALDLCRGPGKLATAMGIARIHDGLDLVVPGPLWLAAGVPPREIRTSVRIGITKAADSLLRFYEADSPFVSGPRKLNS